MTKESFNKKYNEAVKRLDNSITPEYFQEKFALYANDRGTVELPIAMYAVMRESARLNTSFLQDVLENVLEFDD